MFQMVFSICWYPEEVGSHAGFGIVRPRPIGKEQEFFFYVCYICCHRKAWPKFKVDFPTSKDPVLGWVSPLQVIQARKVPHRCTQLLRVHLIPDVVMYANKRSHYSGSYTLHLVPLRQGLIWSQHDDTPLSAPSTALELEAGVPPYSAF